MTVNPGFGGQSFIYETLPKIQQAHAWRREQGLRYNIGVDGGVDFKTARRVRARRGRRLHQRHRPLRPAQPRRGGKKMRKIVEAARLKPARPSPSGCGQPRPSPDLDSIGSIERAALILNHT